MLGVALTFSTVFAQEKTDREGWGVGAIFGGGYLGFTPTLSLKAPMLPIFWGISANINSNYFGIGITGDYYFFDNVITELGPGTLGWYLGVGAYLGFANWRGNYWYNNGNRVRESWTGGSIAGRVPVGLNYMMPLSSVRLEAFIEVAPSIGVGFRSWSNKYTGNNDGDVWPYWNIGGALGVRVWF